MVREAAQKITVCCLLTALRTPTTKDDPRCRGSQTRTHSQGFNIGNRKYSFYMEDLFLFTLFFFSVICFFFRCVLFEFYW